MQPLTPNDIARISRNSARPEYAEALVAGYQEMLDAGINTPQRLAYFLGQCAHETGYFTILRENMNYTPEQAAKLWPTRFGKYDPRLLKAAKQGEQAIANAIYSNRENLGNLGGDDGWDYRGGGLLQHTGRACYAETGAAIGVDLEGEPQLIEDGPISLSASLYTWNKHDCNRFADRGYIHAIGCAINRGDPFSSKDPIGAVGRFNATKRVAEVLGIMLPTSEELALGAWGPEVERLQERLKALGYPVGAIDGVFGPTCARAVAGFKMDHQRRVGLPLELAELVGPLTWRALEDAAPAQVSAERQTATVHTLLAKGSTEMAAGRDAQNVGRALTLGGMFEGARQLGVLETATMYANKVSALRLSLVPFAGALSWFSKHMFFLLLIAAGVWMWAKGGKIIAARLLAHIRGLNLGR